MFVWFILLFISAVMIARHAFLMGMGEQKRMEREEKEFEKRVRKAMNK